MNCNAEISPQYVHAIANNVCPGCGGSIYDDQTKEVYNELKEAMLRMPNDPVGLAGWLLDNYKLYKIGSAEPVDKFYNSNIKENKENKELKSSSKIKTASAEKTSEFFQRAGVSPQTKSRLPKDYSVLVDQINSNVSEDSMYGEDEVEMVEDNLSDEDFSAAREMNARFSDEELLMPGKPLAKSEMKELKALLNKNSTASDTFLEGERMERLQRQENMLSGTGGFKR
jgi:hypothetical protein